MKKGDYFKLVGDYAGVVWTGRSWERFDCVSCVLQQGIAKRAIQGVMTPGAAKAFLGPVIHRHNLQVHKNFMQAHGQWKDLK